MEEETVEMLYSIRIAHLPLRAGLEDLESSSWSPKQYQGSLGEDLFLFLQQEV